MNGYRLMAAMAPCLLAVTGATALAGCAGTSTGSTPAPASGQVIERNERNEVASSLQHEEAAETARNRELLTELEDKTREETAEARAKKTEHLALLKAKKKEHDAALAAKKKEAAAEAAVKKRKEQALQAEAKKKQEESHRTQPQPTKTQPPQAHNETTSTAPLVTATPSPGG